MTMTGISQNTHPASGPVSEASRDTVQQATTRCSLCQQEMRFDLEPGPVAVRCRNCGLRITYTEHLVAEADKCREHKTREETERLDQWLSSEPSHPRARTNWELFCQYGRPYAPVLGVLLFALTTSSILALVGLTKYSSALRTIAELEGRLDTVTAERDSLAVEVTRRRKSADEARRSAQAAAAERDAAQAQLLDERALRLAAEQQRDHYAESQNQVQHQTKLLEAQRLLYRSREMLENRPKESLALAAQAAEFLLTQRQNVPHALEQTLRDALAQNGGRRLKGHQLAVETLALSRDGRWLLTGSCDRTARLWDLSKTDPAAASIELRGHSQRVTAVALAPNGEQAITAGRDGQVIVWDLTAADPSASGIVLGTHAGPITALALAPNGRWLISASEGFGPTGVAARVWDLKGVGGAPLLLRGHAEPIRSIAISRDSRWAALGSEDKTARLFDLRNPIHQVVLDGHQGIVTAMAISPDCRWMVTGSTDNTARLWDLTSEPPRFEVLEGHDGWIEDVAISPDGHWVATGGYDNAALLWDCRTGENFRLEGHTSRIHSIDFTPDGRWLVTGSYDRTLRLWEMQNVAAGDAIVLRGHEGPISAMAIGPGSRKLITVSGDVLGTNDPDVRIWDLQLDDLLATARNTVEKAAEVSTIEREARVHVIPSTDAR